jgi:hypothetical protein
MSANALISKYFYIRSHLVEYCLKIKFLAFTN